MKAVATGAIANMENELCMQHNRVCEELLGHLAQVRRQRFLLNVASTPQIL